MDRFLSRRDLPVVDGNEDLIGVISEGNLMHRDDLGVRSPAGDWLEEIRGGPARCRIRALRVGVVMTPDPVCVDQDATVYDIIVAMNLRKVAQIPVPAV